MRSFSRLVVLHMLANAVLLGLGYYWLGIRESRTSTLLASVLLAVFLAALACVTYSAPFAYFQQEKPLGTLDAWRTALRRIVPVAAAVAMIVAIYWLLGRWGESSRQWAFQLASYLTLKTRTPVRPPTVFLAFESGIWLMRLLVIPVILSPILSAIVARGWSGFRSFEVSAHRRSYWLEVPSLLVCFAWVPLKLLRWVPVKDSFGLEMASFVARAVLAYLLFCAAWLALAALTPRGTPRLTQSSTEVSP